MTSTIYFNSHLLNLGRGVENVTVYGTACVMTDTEFYDFIFMSKGFYHEKFIFMKILAYMMPKLTKDIRVVKTRKHKGYSQEMEYFANRLDDHAFFTKYKGSHLKRLMLPGIVSEKTMNEVVEHIDTVVPYFRNGYNLEIDYIRKVARDDHSDDGMCIKRVKKLYRMAKRSDQFKVQDFGDAGHFLYTRRKDRKLPPGQLAPPF